MRFPLNAAVRSTAGDIPKPAEPCLMIGIFDDGGYWATFGHGSIELPGDMLDIGHKIAALANAAYAQGQEDAKSAMRGALGLEP